jgi:2-C-methyl-D-erythritol 4-phosphate cytidylyltransferase
MSQLAQGVVPLAQDDPDAPGGCAGLRELAGVPMVYRAVQSLAASGCVSRVAVPVPPGVAAQVSEFFTATDDVQVRVLAVAENGTAARVLAALSELTLSETAASEAALSQARLREAVVVHDALHPLASGALVRALLARLAAAGPVAGVVPAAPVTDTLKWVDDDVITGTADRTAYRVAGFPQAYRLAAVRAALVAADPDTLRAAAGGGLPMLVRRAGGVLLTVPAPSESFRVATADDLLLAEAMLAVPR